LNQISIKLLRVVELHTELHSYCFYEEKLILFLFNLKINLLFALFKRR